MPLFNQPLANDPYWLGCNANYDPVYAGLEATAAINAAYTIYFSRLITYGYPMSALYAFCVASSGNINAGVWNADASGLPGTLQAYAGTNTGIACPTGAALATLTMNTSVTPQRGWWVGILADNTTASFRGYGGVIMPGMGQGMRALSNSSSLVFPTTSLTGLTSAGAGNRVVLMASAP